MGPTDLLAWLSSLPPPERDAAIETHLGIGHAPSPSPPGEHCIGYHASGVAPIVRMLVEVPVTLDDVLIDLGSGLGKVVLLARLLTGATARGIELQPTLVDRARYAAVQHGIDVRFTEGDARDTYVGDGTVFFLYVPFTGPVLARVMDRLKTVASLRPIVVVTLGMDLDRDAPWLVRRPIDSFWLTIYDSLATNVPPHPARDRSPTWGSAADAIAFERPRTIECPES